MQESLGKRKEGSAVVAAIVIAIVIGVWVAGAMQSSMTEYKMSKRYLETQSALNLAEAGLEEGVRAYRAKDWTGWQTVGSKGKLKLTSISGVGAGGSDGSVSIYVHDDPTAPSVVSEGSLSDAQGSTVSKQVRVDMSKSSLFANGLLGRRSVILNGNNIMVDSFDSRLGDYTPPGGSNFKSNGNVASLGIQNGDVYVNNADIYGFLATGKSSFNPNVVGPNGSIKEYGASGPKINMDRVTTDFFAELPPVPMPNYPPLHETLPTLSGTTSIGNPLATTPTELWYDRIELSGNAVLTIDGPVKLYVRRNMNMSGNARIVLTNNANVELYVQESLSIAGNGVSNNTRKPERFVVYGVSPYEGGQSINVSGNGQAYGVVYAPNANIHMNGGGSGGTFWGAVVGLEITLNGHWGFHYDEALRELGGGNGINIKLWRELKSAEERMNFSDTGSLAAHF